MDTSYHPSSPFVWPSCFREAEPERVAELELRVTEDGLRELARSLYSGSGGGPRFAAGESGWIVCKEAPPLEANARNLDLEARKYALCLDVPTVGHFGTQVALFYGRCHERIRTGFLVWVGLETYDLWHQEPWACSLRLEIAVWLKFCAENLDESTKYPGSTSLADMGRGLFKNPPMSERAWKDFAALKEFPLDYYRRNPPAGVTPEVIQAIQTSRSGF